MQQITIRKAIPKDAKRWEEIHWAGWNYAYRGIFEDKYLNIKEVEFLGQIEKTAEFLGNNIGIKLVAVDGDGSVVGWLNGGKQEHREDILESEKEFQLAGLYLDPKVIGTGIGKKLLLEFAKWVTDNGGSKFIVGCLDKNKSCGFYRKLGGIPIREEYFHGHREIIFEINIKNLPGFFVWPFD
jgi:GNAT superfamily N-acetyltransferase